MERIAELLRELPLFQSFSLAELTRLIERSQLDTFAPQEVIIGYGQPGRFLGILLEGQAEALITEETGERQQIGTLGPGDFVGEISLLTGEPTTADVVAVDRCRLLLIPQGTFSSVLAVNPAALQVMARAITARLRWRERNQAAQTLVEGAWRNTPDPYGLKLSTPRPMRVLTVNCGDSWLKFSYFETGQGGANLQGSVEGIGSQRSRMLYTSPKGRSRRELGTANHVQAIEALAALLTDPDEGMVTDLAELNVVGHKVVHGGAKYGSPVIVDDGVLRDIEAYVRFAPRHNPLNLLAIQAFRRLVPQVPQVAVFDTSFHHKMPPQAYLYGLPSTLFEQEDIRRYGFHGISHHYAALQAAAHLKRRFQELKIVTCHLDDESSVCAIEHGRSVDTSMGLAPLGGLIASTQCGNLDPSVVIHVMREKGLSIDHVDRMLNEESGLKGLSGLSGDFRDLEDAASRGDHRSITAIQAFCYRIRKYIGAYSAAMGGLDALVFTGHIGEGSAWVRSLACQGLSYTGVLLDEVRNKTVPPRPREVAEISHEGAPIKVLVIPADEGRMIAREAIRALGYQHVAEVIERQEHKEIPVEVSAHHVHLSRDHVDALFGPAYELTHRADLSQPGQYASQETLNLVGPRGRVERVRILGPVRGRTQIEIAMTEEFRLGIKAPIRASGDLEGSPGVTLEGPVGALEIPEGVICAVRHIHMSPEDALSFGLKDRDSCMIRVEGERSLIFDDVLVRVNPDYALAMHIDTDEANAANVRTGMVGYLIGVQDRR